MVFDGFTAILISGYALFALAGPPAETDFIAIWGLKGLRFWHAQGIDIAFLEKGWNVFAHPDYPPLLPLLYDWLALGGGWWRDRWFGALFVLFGLAALLVVRSVLEEDLGSDAAAALATMALVPWAVAPYIGLAEGPMIAYATAGVLLVRRGFVREIPGNVAVGAVLLGLAASTKNEGLTLVACAIIASVASSGLRSTMRLWPAVVIPLPWLIFRSVAGLTTDLATAGVTSRFAGHLREFDEILLAIARTPFGKPFFWAGIAVALLIGGRAMLRRERFLLGTVALQYFFYVGAYFVTPHDISWHVKWSWERVVNQMTLLLAFCAVSVVLLELQRRLTDSQRAEVSSDELRT